MHDYYINCPDNEIKSGRTTKILNEGDAFKFHSQLSGYCPTPLISLSNLAEKYHVKNIYIKDEARRFGLNSFKALGASYAINKILEECNEIDTFCTASDGNHGRAVAWASRMANRKSVVFVPGDTALSRIIDIEKEGAVVQKICGNYDEACAFARKASEDNGWQLIQDMAWENYEEIPALIMSGYLTLFKELEDSLHVLPEPKADIVFLQAGVGSFAGAAIWYYLNRYGKNRPVTVIVEPYESDGLFSSFKAGKRVNPGGNLHTIMAGLNCGIPSLTAWEIIKNGTDVSMKVTDDYSEQAIRELYYPDKNDEKIIAGESGAGGLAGFIALMTGNGFQELRKELRISSESSILFFNTEGATDPVNFNSIIADIKHLKR